MPRFGEAHGLLSARHRDTSPPAGGADPDDGQVATWSAALGAWIAADPTGGGVTDHGLLTGLADNDHPQYALADKSSPSPWVAAGDLAARSLADLGTKDHDLLAGLGDDDHSIYALLTGRSGGQTLIGGSGSGEHLTLRSTSHAVRGRVRSIDDLWLSTGVLRGPDCNARAYLQDASPHLLAFGDVQLGDRASIGAAPVATTGLKVAPSLSSALNMAVIDAAPVVALTGGSRIVYGFKAQSTVNVSSGATLHEGFGLYFTAVAAGAGAVGDLFAAWVKAGVMYYSGAACEVWGLKVRTPVVLASTYPVAVYGVDIEDQGAISSTTQDAYGLKIADQTMTSGAKRLIEAGPATPYLRLIGGANPAANQSNLYLKLGATLKLITEYDADSAGTGHRALRVPN